VTPEGLRLAIGNGVDPSVHDLALALTQLDAHPAFLINNVQTATPLTAQLVAQARAHHVPVIDVTETMAGTDYVAWIGGVVAKVSTALRREGCLA
jgi:zinc/manganese transport system substrate-binding protein